MEVVTFCVRLFFFIDCFITITSDEQYHTVANFFSMVSQVADNATAFEILMNTESMRHPGIEDLFHKARSLILWLYESQAYDAIEFVFLQICRDPTQFTDVFQSNDSYWAQYTKNKHQIQHCFYSIAHSLEIFPRDITISNDSAANDTVGQSLTQVPSI